jgi:nicotinate-nucleotide pyrophosphorylase (carboxylating)
MIVEVEVDTLAQFDEVVTVGPDLILLDNMGPANLREAVARRDARSRAIELEASGGIDLETVRQIAEAGVDRISVGGLTHSAVSLDMGLDW